jgi:hypothetical protein
MPGLETVAERNLDEHGAPMIEWANPRYPARNPTGVVRSTAPHATPQCLIELS